MKKRRILLISHNFSPELIGIGKYNGEMIKWLAAKGYQCTVITTFPYYPFWKTQAPYKNIWYKHELVQYSGSSMPVSIIRCPSYIPSHPTGVKRAVQDFSYLLSKFWVVLNLMIRRKQFDLIITVAPPFHLAYLGLMLRKSTGGKLLYHIQDMQIEAAQDLNMLSNQTLLGSLFKIEQNILHGADFVSSISDGMIHKIKAKVDRDIISFPNWVDTSEYFPLPERHLLKLKWNYHQDDIIFMYSGAIGEKQGLEDILTIADKLKDEKTIKFIICSSGPYKERLVTLASNMGLTNLAFLPVQKNEDFNEFLNMADVHLVMQKANAGDLVMPSKLTTILAVGGVSLVTSYPDTSLYQMMKDFDLGFTVDPGRSDLLKQKILAIKDDASLAIKRLNARNYATKHLNIDHIMSDFLKKVMP
jgi:colanic acid biosynthesis glycosyl transferase WcaI